MNDAVLAVTQARYALKGFLREPRTFVYTLVMPLFLLVILNGIFRGRSSFFRLQVPFAVYYTPAIISYQIMLAGYSSLLIAITTERERGMLKRLRGTPMPSWIFLAGEIMRTVVVVAVTVAALVAVGAGEYRVPVQAHTVIGLAVYTVAGTACMCALGLASTRACATTEAASVAGPFVTLILGFISGVFIPVAMMPSWMLDLGRFFPLEHRVGLVHQEQRPSPTARILTSRTRAAEDAAHETAGIKRPGPSASPARSQPRRLD